MASQSGTCDGLQIGTQSARWPRRGEIDRALGWRKVGSTKEKGELSSKKIDWSGDESLKLSASVGPNADDDLGFQFAPLFALMGVIIMHRCLLGTAIMDSIECVMLRTHPTKGASKAQTINSRSQRLPITFPALSRAANRSL